MNLDDLQTFSDYEKASEKNWPEVRELILDFVGARDWGLSEEELDALIGYADGIAIGDSWCTDDNGEKYFKDDQHLNGCGGTAQYISSTTFTLYTQWKVWAEREGVKVLTSWDLGKIWD